MSNTIHSAAIEWEEDGKEESYQWWFSLPNKDDIVLFKDRELKVIQIRHVFINDNDYLISYIKCELLNA